MWDFNIDIFLLQKNKSRKTFVILFVEQREWVKLQFVLKVTNLMFFSLWEVERLRSDKILYGKMYSRMYQIKFAVDSFKKC